MSLEPCPSVLSGSITGADTAVHSFTPANQPARWLYLSCPSSNSGTVTIGSKDTGSGGLVLAAGAGTTSEIRIGPLLRLDFLTFKFSNANDILNFLLLY
jgi:hypothetical protein